MFQQRCSQSEYTLEWDTVYVFITFRLIVTAPSEGILSVVDLIINWSYFFDEIIGEL